ncbi:MAG: hypothetical protein U1F44_01000 [Coriobacteriia bacterium]|nr:hypothetical protein [Coriobacteriia bacterium]
MIDERDAPPRSLVPPGLPVRKRWPLGIGIVILLIGTCVGMSYLASTVLQDVFSPTGGQASMPSSAYGASTLVGWSGGGRYAIIQYFDEGSVPTVAVWDRETEKTRLQGGYIVVGIESEAPQIWLEPAKDVIAPFDSFSDPIDHKPAQLFAWRLDGGDSPQDSPPAKWRSWPGPGGYIAYLELDVLKGCMPAKLLINNNESSGEGVKAALPESTRTFTPVGWSPSGKYFAIEELMDGNEIGVLGELVLLRQSEQPDRKLLVFSAETGELAAEAVLPKGTIQTPCAAWGANDTLYWADTDAMQSNDDGGSAPDWRSLSVASGAGTIAPPDGAMEMTWAVTTLGSDEAGARFFTDNGRLWCIGADGFAHAGNLRYAESADWDVRGGLLVTRTEYEWDGEVERNYASVSLFDEHGGSEREIWHGPHMEVGRGPGF